MFDLRPDQFHTVRRLPPYVFAQVAEIVAAARAEGKEVLDLSMGSPDMRAPQIVIDALKDAVDAPDASRYSASAGVEKLRKACADYYGRRFGVRLDPDLHVVSTLGSKNAFANLATAITAPGDVVLVPNPSYPIHTFGFILAGGVVRPYPVEPNDNLFRQAEWAIRYSTPKPIAMVLNYPANPTTKTADFAFFEEAVRFARKHELFILSDLAYAEIYYDEPPHSILEVPGARDLAVEFTSASKSFNMAGWRVGFTVGNERLIQALTRVKSYLDYGSFAPIQHATALALDNAEAITADVRIQYRARRDAFLEAASAAGWDLPKPDASMFIWAPLPKGETDSVSFCKRMVREAGVALSPGVGFGEGGTGHIRIALVAPEDQLASAATRIARAI
ncbi:aminotransferase class I/II-fold pyridoxal phosphate-dependent enzyme [Parvularcula lutaonensis]|uniref:Aminotransferase n=1 Tax=Parvularcula lutaonensis TaxID=491923 RepID=A0ABV7MF86_9PROT|nr:aminotransferase class I/II-fold pyridoxal phosphate-dependent enzyme [Parvularcula lutaonensis]GGY49445.1 aminotransferase [Parvularcula lutaonensis]